MAKQRKSRTVSFLKTQPEAKLPSPEEVNQTVAKVTGKTTTPPEEKPKPKPKSKTRSSSKPEPKSSVVQRSPKKRTIQPKPDVPEPEPIIIVKPKKRMPLTTAITPENRAKLEVASIHSKESVADMINEALEHYFETVVIIQDQALIDTFTAIYSRKAK